MHMRPWRSPRGQRRARVVNPEGSACSPLAIHIPSQLTAHIPSQLMAAAHRCAWLCAGQRCRARRAARQAVRVEVRLWRNYSGTAVCLVPSMRRWVVGRGAGLGVIQISQGGGEHSGSRALQPNLLSHSSYRVDAFCREGQMLVWACERVSVTLESFRLSTA